jgi:hypothetical protein
MVLARKASLENHIKAKYFFFIFTRGGISESSEHHKIPWASPILLRASPSGASTLLVHRTERLLIQRSNIMSDLPSMLQFQG